MPSRSFIPLMLCSATVSGLVALVVAWPVAIHAEDPEATADAANAVKLAPNATHFGDIVASSELISDEKTKKHYIRFVAQNTSEQREAYAKIELSVVKWASSPDSRVSPPPEVAYERTFRLVLPPGMSDVRDIAIGAQLAQSLEVIRQREKAMEAGDPNVELPPIFESYEASIRIPSADSTISAPETEPTEELVADAERAG